MYQYMCISQMFNFLKKSVCVYVCMCFLYCGAGEWTQGLAHARQVLGKCTELQLQYF
jgi:hypothetical protein